MKSRKRRSFFESGPKVEIQEFSWKEKVQALLQSNPLINGVMALAITVGFFHGWLKIRFHSPATTFLFDALLSVAMVLSFLKIRRRESFIPAGPIGTALKLFYGVCFLYMFFPGGPPFLISLAAFRGWCFATLMFSLGYQITHDIKQVKSYFYVLILLGLITAIYGLRQTPQEVEKEMEQDENFAERYQNTYYHTTKGRQLRIFSTFVSSGAFGGTMAYVMIFGIVLLSDPTASKQERFVLTLIILPIALAIVRSGSRSALVSLGFGFLVIAWHRRNLVNFVLIPLCLFLAIKLGFAITGGSAMERYSTLLNFDEVYGRNSLPTRIGWDFMMDDHLFGGGLGKSGYSVPNFLSIRLGYREYFSSDGDLGRLMIELGISGLFFFGNMLYVSGKTVVTILKQLRETEVSTVALSSAACIVMAIASFPSGSPFLGIPMGALVWFFLGTLQKLSDEFAKGSLGGVSAETLAAAKAKNSFREYRKSLGSPKAAS